MPRKVNPDERKAQYDGIKHTARVLMQEHGTAGLSIRAIARAVDLTPPALYYYFENLDALITALIVDGFNGIADAMEDATDVHREDHPAEALLAILMAYRQWALDHPADFQLLYGNPIPGFHAPREITVPAVIRGFIVIITAIQAVLDAGEVEIPAYILDLPPETEQTYLRVMSDVNETTEGQRETMSQLSVEAMTLGIAGWSQMHGLIMLELFEHLPPVVGDTDVYFRHQMLTMFQTFGFRQ